MRGTEDGYLKEQQQLLPMGHAWSREESSVITRLLRGLALTWAKAHNRALNLLREANPYTTFELLTDWERALGLPDECSKGLADTLQERRANVAAKYLDEGRQDIAYYYELAKSLGYEITIIEYRPFIPGISRCGDRLNGGHDVRYEWTVKVHGPRVILFRCGASTPPERLGVIRRAKDLECRIRKNAQAHSYPIFDYEIAPGNGAEVQR